MYIDSPEKLKEMLPINERSYRSILRISKVYPIRITRYYMDLIDRDDPSDPIRRQVIPSPAELWVLPHEKSDPLDEKRYMPCPRLIHRYRDRVLLLVSSRCAVHCRFCFRKEEIIKQGAVISRNELDGVIGYLLKHPDIREVILSGGEPLILKNHELFPILERIKQVPHIGSIRIHTRMPVVLPSRVDRKLVEGLKAFRPCWIVTHFNHPRELTPQAAEALSRFIESGFPVLNQSVLLKGVNDDLSVLLKLCRHLIVNRVKPYYIHLLDPARGICHFNVPYTRAIAFSAEMQARLPGYAVPLFVRDDPGMPGKQVLK